jgi:hypothetical protein
MKWALWLALMALLLSFVRPEGEENMGVEEIDAPDETDQHPFRRFSSRRRGFYPRRRFSSRRVFGGRRFTSRRFFPVRRFTSRRFFVGRRFTSRHFFPRAVVYPRFRPRCLGSPRLYLNYMASFCIYRIAKDPISCFRRPNQLPFVPVAITIKHVKAKFQSFPSAQLPTFRYTA